MLRGAGQFLCQRFLLLGGEAWALDSLESLAGLDALLVEVEFVELLEVVLEVEVFLIT